MYIKNVYIYIYIDSLYIYMLYKYIKNVYIYFTSC